MKTPNTFHILCLTAGMACASSASQANLLDLSPLEPTISFSGSGMIEYNASTGMVTLSGDPATLISSEPFLFGEILGTGTEDIKDISINFQVDANGAVIPGDMNSPDLVIVGSVDIDFDGIADYTGTLLTAEISQFGFLNGDASGDDSFDFRLNNIGGELAYLYSGLDLAISVTSEVSAEYSNAFAGSFNADWQGQAKGLIGAVAAANIPPVTGGCKIKLASKCSVKGAPFQDKCRIKVTRSPKHWERCEYTHNGKTFYKSKYGMHGDPVPRWAANYSSTDVTFKYIVSNTGENPISDIAIEDSFDTPVTNYPTSLAVGTSFTVTRTIALSEGIENDVNVLGSFGSDTCSADDVVTVKYKLRERRKFDDDDYKDKGRRDHDD